MKKDKTISKIERKIENIEDIKLKDSIKNDLEQKKQKTVLK